MPSSKERKLPASFWALNVCQFIGALNDNVYRWIMAWGLVTRASVAGDQINELPIFIAGVVFAIPFILFSPAAGVLADRVSKRRMIVLVNLLAVVVMTLGLFAFVSNTPILIYTVLFLMATQSALFGPSKLGIIPEIVRIERLSFANGLMESFVYIAIILGTIGGGWLYGVFGANVEGASTASLWRASLFCMAFAGLGLLASLFIRDTGVRAGQKGLSPFFWKDVARNIRSCGDDRYLRLTLFAIAFFLFLGAFVQINVATYGTIVLGLTKPQATNLFLPLAFGIGVGSYLAGRISGRNIEIGLVPAGALIVSAALTYFLLPIRSTLLAVVDLLILGVGGGFYVVPLHAFLQKTAPERNRGELIATSSFLSFCGVGLGSLLLLVLTWIGLGPMGRFAFLGAITLAATLYTVWILPDFLIRFIGLIVARLVYRLDVAGAEHVPQEGGALIVCNHVSYSDAVLLMATQQRRIRFMMYRSIYSHRRLGWLFRLMQAIPIADDDPPKEIVRSLQTARRAIDEGWLVCIFAEGSLTRTGYIMEFKRGFERIMKGSSHPVIPANLHGVWGSLFSYAGGRVFNRLPRPPRPRVTVSFGAPLAASATAFEVRQAVMELESQAFERERARARPLPEEFAATARRQWGRAFMSDTTGKRLTFGRGLVGALAMKRLLRADLTKDETHVGLLLPTSVGGALANLAVSFMGRVPVNLNFTASREAIESAIGQCEIRHVVTSRRFVEKVGLDNLPGPIFLEDLMGRLAPKDKILASLQGRFCPLRYLVSRRGDKRRRSVDSTASIIFSSGSTGQPKGVELTHYNILSNVRAVQQVLRIAPDDTICGVLPFFHSFGFTGTLWLPALAGIGVAYHYSPIEAETIGKVVEESRCTLLVSTPTFLLAYIRRIKPEQFKTLRLVITGAEKMRPRTAAAFEKRFGIVPMEGYGATELSPVASVNVPDVEADGVYQKAYQPGTIGRPIPGVTMKVVDPDDLGRELGFGEEGMLLVRGPNVMKGYLRQPEKTREAMRGAWYVTGDVARIDHDGFVTITDRMSRFSKIAGEMVPHLAVEEKIQECLGASEPVCAVTSLPDEKKGERLVVLLTPEAGDPTEVHAKLKESGLPNLWIPALGNIATIDAIPVLGSGKVDLKALRTLAEERLGSKEEK
ncbi:MFS transporter [Candidatus Sumerlaeota bacterium]|nr:MFS transporter [Candidatus Sumerlaeota bacterium]